MPVANMRRPLSTFTSSPLGRRPAPTIDPSYQTPLPYVPSTLSQGGILSFVPGTHAAVALLNNTTIGSTNTTTKSAKEEGKPVDTKTESAKEEGKPADTATEPTEILRRSTTTRGFPFFQTTKAGKAAGKMVPKVTFCNLP